MDNTGVFLDSPVAKRPITFCYNRDMISSLQFLQKKIRMHQYRSRLKSESILLSQRLCTLGNTSGVGLIMTNSSKQSTPFKNFLNELSIDDVVVARHRYIERANHYDGSAYSRIACVLEHVQSYCALHPDLLLRKQAHAFAEVLFESIQHDTRLYSSDSAFLVKRLCEKSLCILDLQYPMAIPTTLREVGLLRDAAQYAAADLVLPLISKLPVADQAVAYGWFFAEAFGSEVRKMSYQQLEWDHTSWLKSWLDNAPEGTWTYLACIERMPFWLRSTVLDNYHIPPNAYPVLQEHPGVFLFLAYYSCLPPLRPVPSREALDLKPDLTAFDKRCKWISLDEIFLHGPEIVGFYALHFPELQDARFHSIRELIGLAGTTSSSGHSRWFVDARLSPAFVEYAKSQHSSVSHCALMLDHAPYSSTEEGFC